MGADGDNPLGWLCMNILFRHLSNIMKANKGQQGATARWHITSREIHDYDKTAPRLGSLISPGA